MFKEVDSILKEIQKTSIEKISNVKRERRRKRLQPFFYVAVVVLVLILIITLSMTVLFNIKTIKVEGSSEYDASEIVKASEIYKGDNLVRLNTDSAKQKILTNLMYIDDVTIKKEFPSTLVIETVASIPAMNIQNGGEYIIVSEGLKKLSISTVPSENLLQVIGFEPNDYTENTKISSTDEHKAKVLSTIYSQLKNLDMLDSIVSVDISDKYDIIINYSDRIYIKLGAYSDLDYKIRYANTVITQNIPEQKSGYLIFVNSNSASFVEKDKFESYSEQIAEITTNTGSDTSITTPYIDTVSINETFDFTDTEEYINSYNYNYEESQEVVTSISSYNVGDDVSIVYGSN